MARARFLAFCVSTRAESEARCIRSHAAPVPPPVVTVDTKAKALRWLSALYYCLCRRPMENGGPAVLAPSPHAVSTRRKVPGGRGAASALDRQRGAGLHDAGHLPRQSTELM